MLWLLLLLIFIRPFISSLAFPYLEMAYSYCLLFSLAAWILFKGLPLKQIKPIKYPLILFCLAIIISFIFSQNRTAGIKELYKYATGILLLFIASSLTVQEKIRLLRTIVFAGLIISALAIYQYFFGFQNLSHYIAKEKINDPFILDYISRKRAFFPFVTPNILGGYLAMIIPLALIFKKRIWFLIPLSFALLLTQSLGAMLSLFFGMSVYFFLKGTPSNKKVVFWAGLFLFIAAAFFTRISMLQQHTRPLFSMLARLNYWEETLKIIKVHPLSGVGIGNFNLPQSRYAHNSYLQLWTETNLLGLISFLWLIVTVLRSALQNIKNPTCKKESICLATACIIFLTHNLIDFAFFLPEVATIWWITLGILLSLPKNNESIDNNPHL